VTTQQALTVIELVTMFLRFDHEDREQCGQDAEMAGPYGPGETASVYRAASELASEHL